MNIIANLVIITNTVFLKLNKDNQLKDCKYSKNLRQIRHLLSCNSPTFKIHSSKSNDVEY